MSQLLLPSFNFRTDARKSSRADQKIIVVGFAGGGGTCRGVEKALGRGPDIAINHDRDAIEMHRVNHPACRHVMTDIRGVDPVKVTRGRSVGLAWFSPDCTHFSQAKGGTPVEKEIRDLAWVVVKWAKEVGPDVIMLENVREFLTWGPLIQSVKNGIPQLKKDGTPALVPDPERKGETFKAWKACLIELGYEVDHWILKACDYGVNTTRPRLYLVARRDGKPIVRPVATHGPKGSGLKKYRTFAECADFSLPCPSIFMSREEATIFRKATGISCVRPLAQNTLDRIGVGYWRYVGNNPKPFIVRVAHGSGAGRGKGDHATTDPLPTIAASGDFALVSPYVAGVGGRAGQSLPTGGDDPLGTITGKNDRVVITPYLIERYGEREGQQPRAKSVDNPLGVVTGQSNTGTLIAPSLVQVNHGDEFRGQDVREPLPTISAKHGYAIAAPILVGAGGPSYSGKPTPADALIGTVQTENHRALVTAFLSQHQGQSIGTGVDSPVNTMTGVNHHSLTSAHVTKLYGTSEAGQPVTDPLHTVSSGGNHHYLTTARLDPVTGLPGQRLAQVYAFLIQYYGQSIGQAITEPIYTITGHDRFGLVTVSIDGHTYAVADIGMRMLTPRELLNAQFTPEIAKSYVLTGTKTSQVHKIGNSVCPLVAAALISANCPDLKSGRAA